MEILENMKQSEKYSNEQFESEALSGKLSSETRHAKYSFLSEKYFFIFYIKNECNAKKHRKVFSKLKWRVTCYTRFYLNIIICVTCHTLITSPPHLYECEKRNFKNFCRTNSSKIDPNEQR
jgi:hypothetical protein